MSVGRPETEATPSGNVFVLGLDDFNRQKLEHLGAGTDLRFHGVLDPHTILEGTDFPIEELLDDATREIRDAGTTVDAIIGYVDFPVSTMLPLLAERFGLPAVSLESVLMCEHKYWSRVVQAEIVPDHIPSFETFDPFDDDSIAAIGLAYPYWIKPLKSAGSFLGFRISAPEQLDHAVQVIRDNIRIFSDPFERVLERAELPDAVAAVRSDACLAESLIGGHQCTLEGSVQDGQVSFHGTIDSIRAPNQSSFLRYEYPSNLPAEVQQRMQDITSRLLGHIDFDDSPFNVEFFWDDHTDQLWLLEVNPRIAQHHSDLFEKVDGVSNHRVAVDIALGRPVDFPHGAGPFEFAACCWLRASEDGLVIRTPSHEEITALAAEIPGLSVDVHLAPGTRLSELTHQDSYSYVLGLFYVGAQSRDELAELDQRCRDELSFEIRL
ncbi:MAG: ATP-grasp domain-containing protein [Acidimicrobiales bacterium]|nr:ATP-grasp domain-containing protein [Acidimicrobiales bacterium]